MGFVIQLIFILISGDGNDGTTKSGGVDVWLHHGANRESSGTRSTNNNLRRAIGKYFKFSNMRVIIIFKLKI